MKKVNLILVMTVVLSLLFVSCSSLPKKVKAGDTLVIGKVEGSYVGFAPFEDVKINGVHQDNFEVTITNLKDNTSKIYHPDQKGFFIIKDLIAGESYAMTYVKQVIKANSGAYWEQWVTIPEEYQRVFRPIDNKVVNIGLTFFTFDGAKNWATWNTDSFQTVRNFFTNLDEESEWLEKEIVVQ